MSPEDKIQQLEQKIKRLEKVTCDADFAQTKVDLVRDLRSDVHSANTLDGDEIDFRELWQTIWNGRLKVLAITVVFALFSAVYALSLPNIYKSEALLMANSKDGNNSGLSALAGQFGGLASLAGVNLGSSETDKTSLALEVLKSREFLYKFIKENQLKVAIMAAEGWDRETDTLRYDSGLFDIKTKTWVRDVKAPYKPEPSLQETYETFSIENLSLSKDDETGMIKLAVEHYSPFLAKELVDKLIQAINQTIKQQDMEEALKSIRYLEKELENTKLSGAQTMFYQLIEQQQQTLMLTKVRDDYVLKVVDRAIVAEEQVRPNRLLICILGLMLGGILGLGLVLVLGFRNK